MKTSNGRFAGRQLTAYCPCCTIDNNSTKKYHLQSVSQSSQLTDPTDDGTASQTHQLTVAPLFSSTTNPEHAAENIALYGAKESKITLLEGDDAEEVAQQQLAVRFTCYAVNAKLQSEMFLLAPQGQLNSWPAKLNSYLPSEKKKPRPRQQFSLMP